MNSFESRAGLYFPSVLGVRKAELDDIIKNIDTYYKEKVEEKYDKDGNIKKYADGTPKVRIIRPSYGRLKVLQGRIKTHILDKIPLYNNIHGGVKRRSNITNAKPHQGKKFVLATDLRDFFPSIKSGRINKVFKELGFNSQFSYYLTRLTTWKGELPQGTPTSTAIANLAFQQTDITLIELCNSKNITYTRFVDDLTFSSQTDFQEVIPQIIDVVKSSGLQISWRKTKYGGLQKITGIMVYNDKIDAPKNIIERSQKEIQENLELKPYTNYRHQITKTNSQKRDMSVV